MALVVFMGLMAVALILVIVADDLGASLQNWLHGNQNQAVQGPGSQGDPNVNPASDVIPEISNRYYDSGGATSSIGGGPFSLSGAIQIDPHASYTQDGLTWISFIDNGHPDAGEILIVFGEPENSVTLAQGDTNVIIGNDDECKFDIKVTDGSVSGTVKCAKADVMTGFPSVPSGLTAAIDLQFSTATTLMDGDGGAGDGSGGDDGSTVDPGDAVQTPTDGG